MPPRVARWITRSTSSRRIPAQWLAILTGAGERAFCAGADLKQQAAEGGIEMPRSGFGGLTSRFDLTKPVIAAVNGVALGGGFELALACDLIIAADSASFALPEPRVGLAALGGGILRLVRQIPEKQALGMILTGRRVTAAEGRELGFVNEVVAAPELLGAARRWADMILAGSPMSIRASKAIAQRGSIGTLEEASRLQLGYPETVAMMASADYAEGPRAFAEKRQPRWSGR
jgi:enoyl-CoA hydratase/carnithine racemase